MATVVTLSSSSGSPIAHSVHDGGNIADTDKMDTDAPTDAPPPLTSESTNKQNTNEEPWTTAESLLLVDMILPSLTTPAVTISALPLMPIASALSAKSYRRVGDFYTAEAIRDHLISLAGSDTVAPDTFRALSTTLRARRVDELHRGLPRNRRSSARDGIGALTNAADADTAAASAVDDTEVGECGAAATVDPPFDRRCDGDERRRRAHSANDGRRANERTTNRPNSTAADPVTITAVTAELSRSNSDGHVTTAESADTIAAISEYAVSE